MLGIFDWLPFLRPKNAVSRLYSHEAAASQVRLLVITSDDDFYSVLKNASADGKWTMHRATSIQNGLHAMRADSLPLIIVDWTAPVDDWRPALDAICAEPKRPCVILASRVIDENLRREVLRYGGYDVLPRSADRQQIVREINFAWFWITRSDDSTRNEKRQEAQP